MRKYLYCKLEHTHTHVDHAHPHFSHSGSPFHCGTHSNAHIHTKRPHSTAHICVRTCALVRACRCLDSFNCSCTYTHSTYTHTLRTHTSIDSASFVILFTNALSGCWCISHGNIHTTPTRVWAIFSYPKFCMHRFVRARAPTKNRACVCARARRPWAVCRHIISNVPRKFATHQNNYSKSSVVP